MPQPARAGFDALGLETPAAIEQAAVAAQLADRPFEPAVRAALQKGVPAV